MPTPLPVPRIRLMTLFSVDCAITISIELARKNSMFFLQNQYILLQVVSIQVSSLGNRTQIRGISGQGKVR